MPLSTQHAMQILLEGTCGINYSLIERETGLSREAISRFFKGTNRFHTRTYDALGLFIFRQLNKHLLISKEDLES